MVSRRRFLQVGGVTAVAAHVSWLWARRRKKLTQPAASAGSPEIPKDEAKPITAKSGSNARSARAN